MAALIRQQLDPRSVLAGRLGGWIFTAGVLIVGGGGALAALLGSGAPLVSWVATGAIAATIVGLLGFASHVGPALRYRTTWLRVDEAGLEIERGAYWRHLISVPRPRIQHTDVTQSPFERRFGLATLVVYTAGTEHASIPIEGLAHETALALRDALLVPAGTGGEAREDGGDAV